MVLALRVVASGHGGSAADPEHLRDARRLQDGRWQENQRQAHRRGKLPSSRVARLESAGIVWDALEAAWGEAYYKFLELPPDHRGYRSVAQGYVDKDGFKLGMWQARRKKEEKKEEKKEGSQRPILPPMSRTHLPYTPANVFV